MEWLDDDYELSAVASVFLRAPWEYSGMGSLTGKQYAPLKDLATWRGLDVEKWVPVLLDMAAIWASEVAEK